MTNEHLQSRLEQLIAQLRNQPQNAKLLYTEHLSLWQALNLDQTQVELWLASLSINYQQQPNTSYQVTPDLGAHLVALLQQSDGRMPLAQALKKLPAGVTASEQQIRKLAQQHSQLAIKGPLLVLVS